MPGINKIYVGVDKNMFDLRLQIVIYPLASLPMSELPGMSSSVKNEGPDTRLPHGISCVPWPSMPRFLATRPRPSWVAAILV